MSRRWLGSRMGPQIDNNAPGNAPSAVYSFPQQYEMQMNSAWHAPAYIEATGGEVTDLSSYRYHFFETTTPSPTANFVVSSCPPTATMEYIIVAGGGAGGSGGGSGGGAGGMITGTTPAGTITSATYTCTVGDGGVQNTTNPSPLAVGGNGGDTTLTLPGGTPLVAAGGGGGGFRGLGAHDGHMGGSGGGGYPNGEAGAQFSPTSPKFPAPAPGQGNPGGEANPSPPYGGGGGGGYGGAGQAADSNTTGNGGVGVQIPGPFQPMGPQNPKYQFGDGATGESYFVCGGGGGGGEDASGTTGGGGGATGPTGTRHSGGGPGANPSAPSPNPYGNGYGYPGTDGTGGGGGGADRNTSGAKGGEGGSGFIFIRYPHPG